MENSNTLNEAEEFVYKVCRRSFLSLWSYPNPQGRDASKELCDILIVCEPDIVIFSVKDIKLTNSGDEELDFERWRRKAVEASIKQIYGAERFLKTASQITRKDGTPGLVLSKNVDWQFHRVAVALGSQGKVPFSFDDFEKGFVHIFDEISFGAIVQELDTITDFVDYLKAKERLYNSGVAVVFEGAEEDLLALYLHEERKFPDGPDLFVLSKGLWDSLSQRSEVRRRKEANQNSQVWDRLIEEMCRATPNLLETGPIQTQDELIVRTMARENRFSRRVLGVAYRDFLIASKETRTRSRLLQSLSNIVYVFVHGPHDSDLRYRESELGCRCFIARGLVPDCETVIGISTEEWQVNVGCYSKLLYLHMPDWTQEDQSEMEEMREVTGFFKSPIHLRVRGDEFPQREADNVRLEAVAPDTPCPCNSGKRYKHCHGRRH